MGLARWTCLASLSWGILDKWPNQYICTPSIRRSGSTFKALRISQLRTLSRSVTPGTLRKNPISAAFPGAFRSLPKNQDHRSGSEQRLIQKLTALRCLKHPFCDQRAIKLMKNCVSFTNLYISLLAPPFVTRKYHLYVLEFLHLLRCISLTCSTYCLWFVERHNTSVFLVLIFILDRSHAAEILSSAC